MKGRFATTIAAMLLGVSCFAQRSPNDQGGFGGGSAAAPKPVEVKAGDTIPAGDLRYRVVRIQSGLKEYIQRYDQRQFNMKPTFGTDQLVVVELEVENTGEISTDPTTYCFRLIDSEGGVSSPGVVDARLQSGVVATGLPAGGNIGRASLAPKGKTKLAMVFSIPPSAKAKAMEVSYGSRVVTQGVIVDVPGAVVAKVALDKG